MKIYISGPITGHDDYMERFAAAENQIKQDFPNAGIINPARTSATLPADQMEYGEYMKICLPLLDLCDMVCMIGEWMSSKGARLEYDYALSQGKTVIHLKGEWEK